MTVEVIGLVSIAMVAVVKCAINDPCTVTRFKEVNVTRMTRQVVRMSERENTACSFLQWLKCERTRQRDVIKYAQIVTSQYEPVKQCCGGYTGVLCDVGPDGDRDDMIAPRLGLDANDSRIIHGIIPAPGYHDTVMPEDDENITIHSTTREMHIFKTPTTLFKLRFLRITENRTMTFRTNSTENQIFQCLVHYQKRDNFDFDFNHMWYRNNVSVNNLGRRFNFFNGQLIGKPVYVASFTITNVTKRDLGEYQCRARVANLTITASRTLIEAIITPEMNRESMTDDVTNYVVLATLTSLLVVVSVCLVITPVCVYKRRYHIKLACVYYCGRSEIADGRAYDAYLSYTAESDDVIHFVFRHLLPAIESRGISLYVAGRDDIPGEVRSGEIQSAMENSRRVILLISPCYLDNEWCRFECITAQQQFVNTKLKIIPVLFGTVDRTCVLKDKDIQTLLRVFPLVDWTYKSSASKKWGNISDRMIMELVKRLPRKRTIIVSDITSHNDKVT